MKVTDAFPSKYLKAEDLKNRRIPVVINHVVLEDIGDDQNKMVIYFQNTAKGMVLNKTNASQISYLYGDETDLWAGKPVELYTMMVNYQGRMVPGLRVAPPAGQTVESGTMPDGRPVLPNTSGQDAPAGADEDPFGFDA